MAERNDSLDQNAETQLEENCIINDDFTIIETDQTEPPIKVAESNLDSKCVVISTADRTSIIDTSLSLVSCDDVDAIHSNQRHILDQLENSNAKLAQVNRYSIHRFVKLAPRIKNNTKTLLDTKKELDSIFRRIRALQAKVESQYPQSYKKALLEVKSTQTVDTDD